MKNVRETIVDFFEALNTLNKEKKGMRRNKKNNVYRNGRAEKKVMTALAAAVIVGASAGATQVTAHADTLTDDTQMIPVSVKNADQKDENPGTDTAAAEKIADEAGQQASEAETAMHEAEAVTADARQLAIEAANTAAAAEDTATEAIRDAVNAAQTASDDAASRAETAAQKVNDAEGDVQTAQTAVEQSEAADSAAAQNQADVEASAGVTEKDVAQAEADASDKAAAASEAAAAVTDAETAAEAAAAEQAAAVTESNDASQAAAAAELAATEADQAVSDASAEAAATSSDLKTAEDLKNGSASIQNTEQYKDFLAKKESLAQAEAAEAAASEAKSEASAQAETAAQKTAEAADVKEQAVSALADAGDVVKDASDRLADAQKKAADAEKAVDQAGIASDAAKVVADAAKAEASAASAAADSAQEASNAAAAALKTAEESLANAESALDTATDNAENSSSKVAELKNTRDFFSWLAEHASEFDLTEEQVRDLENAVKMLDGTAPEWDGSVPVENPGNYMSAFKRQYYKDIIGYSHPGEAEDATSLENLRVALDYAAEGNEKRAEENLQPLKISASQMAAAEINVNWICRNTPTTRSDFAHSNAFAGLENIAMGSQTNASGRLTGKKGSYDPYTGWYTEEKANYQSGSGETGHYKTLTDRQGTMVNTGLAYRTTTMNTTVTWTYSDGTTKDETTAIPYDVYSQTFGENSAYCLYYSEGVEISRFSSMLDSYETWLDSMTTTYQTAKEQAAAAVTAAEKDLQEKKTASASADAALTEAAAKREAAQAKSDSAQKALETAEKALKEAQSSCDDAQTAEKAAETSYTQAVDAYQQAETALAQAEKAYDAAAQTQAEKAYDAAAQIQADKAAKATSEAREAYAAASERLQALTSDDMIRTLRERKESADKKLAAAEAEQNRCHTALIEAQKASVEAAERLETAEKTFAEASDRLASAKTASAEAEKVSKEAGEKLNAVRTAYSSVQEVRTARKAAADRLTACREAYANVENALAERRAELTQAKAEADEAAENLTLAKAITLDSAIESPITTPAFTYLNASVENYKNAKTAAVKASANLQSAENELAVKTAAYAQAKAAWDDALTVLENVRKADQATVVQPELPAVSTDDDRKSTATNPESATDSRASEARDSGSTAVTANETADVTAGQRLLRGLSESQDDNEVSQKTASAVTGLDKAHAVQTDDMGALPAALAAALLAGDGIALIYLKKRRQ